MADDHGRVADATARALLSLPMEWTVMPDVAWPDGGHPEVDHVVIGPGGVFVIDARDSGGRIDRASAAAADALASGARLSRRLVHAVVCAPGGSELESSRRGGEVLLCKPDDLVATLLAREPVLDGARLSSTRANVANAVRGERSPSVTARASRRRTRSAGSLGRLGAFLLLVAVTVGMAPYAAARLEDEIRPGPVPTPELGTVVLLAAAGERPPAELLPEEADGTTPRSYAVRLAVRNTGDAALSLDRLSAEVTLDDTSVVAPASGAQALAGVRLEPGRERTVTYRFPVPAERSAEFLRVRVGDGPADHALWLID